jgi:glutamate/tyrosine decarboxylase-like PLP-dependent enzyme
VFAIVCSLHKKFGSNRVGGVVIGRKTEGSSDGNEVEYLSGAVDDSVEGSRNGHMALGLWIRLKLYAWQGYIDQARRCADEAGKFAQALVDRGVPETFRITGATTVCFPKPPNEFCEKYSLAPAKHGADFIAHFIVTATVAETLIADFTAEYLNWYNCSRQE